MIDAARRVAGCQWQEIADPISTSRRRMVELCVAVANLDGFGDASAAR